MGTYWNNSGSAAGAISGSLTRLISEFEPMIRASRIGHLLGARVPNQRPSTKVSMQYFLRNTFVDGSGLNTGERLLGQLVPTAEPGQWRTADGQLSDLGSEVRIDSADGYTVDTVAEMDEAGTMQTFDRCLDYIDLKASELLAGASTPWTTADQASSAWTTTTFDIKKEISDALQAVEAAVGERLPEGRLKMVVGSATYEAMKYNDSWTSLWGGAASLGSLDHGQLTASLKSIGISELLVGLDSRYGEFVNIYVSPPEGASIATPGGRMLMGAGLVMPHAGPEGGLFEVFEPRMIDQRNYGYYCAANCDIVALPEFGVRISGTS